jgi:hypothetical protein
VGRDVPCKLPPIQHSPLIFGIPPSTWVPKVSGKKTPAHFEVSSQAIEILNKQWDGFGLVDPYKNGLIMEN